jgi:branched-chain amino acid transport system permease protein
LDPLSQFFQAVISGILLGGLYVLLAVGLNIVTGVIKIINFAHGDLIMIGMYITFWLSVILGLNPLTVIPGAIVLLAFIGALTYLGIFSLVLRSGPLEQLLVTVGLGLFLQGLAQVLWKSDYRLLRFELPPIVIGELYISPIMLIIFTISLLASVTLYSFLLKTQTGVRIRAVAQDPEMASLMGVDRRKIYLITCMIGFGLAGLAGGLLMLMFPTYPSAGLTYGLMAWLIMVIGGLGSIEGAFVGGMIIGIIEVLISTYWNPELARALVFLLLIAVIALKPEGLMGARARV